MADRKRCCCNCGNCERVRNGLTTDNRCKIDGHWIDYIDTFEGWCKHWCKDHTFDEMEVPK